MINKDRKLLQKESLLRRNVTSIDPVIKKIDKIGDTTRKIATLSSMTLEEREMVATKIRGQTMHNAPRTVEELWHYTKIVYGIEIPYTATEPHLSSPMEWFASMYFRWYETSMAIGPRGGSKTYYASLNHNINGTFNPDCKSVHAASLKAQSAVAAEYLESFSLDPVTGSVFDQSRINKQSVKWLNGSRWSVVTASVKGVSGQHPEVLTLDEIEFWKIPAIEQSFAVPLRAYGRPSVWAAFSTRQRAFGAANWLVNEAPKRGIKTFTWTVFETMQPCKTCIAIDQAPHGSDKERQKVCGLWEDCHGRRGVKSTGWVPREDVLKMKRTKSTDAWEAEFLCKKPSLAGLVLMNFEHAYSPQGNYSKWVYDPMRPYWVAHDPAEGKISVMYMIQADDNGGIHIFDEIVNSSCPDVTQSKEDLYVHMIKRGYPPPDAIIVDPHRTDAVATWRTGSKYGDGLNRRFNAVCPSMKKSNGGVGNEIIATLEILKKFIQDGSGSRSFFINPEMCRQAVMGVKEYHYRFDIDGSIMAGSNPSKDYSDHVDPMRYFMMWWTNQAQARSYIKFIEKRI